MPVVDDESTLKYLEKVFGDLVRGWCSAGEMWKFAGSEKRQEDLKGSVYKGATGGEDVDRSVTRFDVEFSKVAKNKQKGRGHTRKR
jgi:hypothetical protein